MLRKKSKKEKNATINVPESYKIKLKDYCNRNEYTIKNVIEYLIDNLLKGENDENDEN